MNKSEDEKEQEYEIEKYYFNTYKDTEEIIIQHRDFFLNLENIKNVYVLGHSFSEIDADYFQKIRKTVGENCKWLVSCHKKKTQVKCFW